MSARGRHLDCVSARRLRQCDIAADIDQTSSTESLQRACMTATQALDYDFYLFGGYYPIVEGIVMSSRFPAAWRSRYDSNNYLAIDPVVRHCWQESSAVVWSRIRHAEGKLGEQERKLMNEAAYHGLRSGISIPVHGAGAEGSMLSLASREARSDDDQHDEYGLHIIVQAMHEATRRIIASSVSSRVHDVESLSPREIECLSWTAKGRSSWAISGILILSTDVPAEFFPKYSMAQPVHLRQDRVVELWPLCRSEQ